MFHTLLARLCRREAWEAFYAAGPSAAEFPWRHSDHFQDCLSQRIVGTSATVLLARAVELSDFSKAKAWRSWRWTASAILDCFPRISPEAFYWLRCVLCSPFSRHLGERASRSLGRASYRANPRPFRRAFRLGLCHGRRELLGWGSRLASLQAGPPQHAPTPQQTESPYQEEQPYYRPEDEPANGPESSKGANRRGQASKRHSAPAASKAQGIGRPSLRPAPP